MFPTSRECNCNSGNIRYPLHDARGIFVSYVCEACEEEVQSKYRPEIFENPNYDACEPIDDEDDLI